MKVLILGGDGFCGWPTALHLSEGGAEVVIVDNLSRGFEQAIESLSALYGSKVDFHELDLGNAEGLRSLLKEVRPDAVMHMAGIAYAGESVEDPFRYYLSRADGPCIAL